jgi:hypothetical protein
VQVAVGVANYGVNPTRLAPQAAAGSAPWGGICGVGGGAVGAARVTLAVSPLLRRWKFNYGHKHRTD